MEFMYHYAMVEYKNGKKSCVSLYNASYSDCVKLVSIALNGSNEQIKNAWIESNPTPLTEE